MINTRCATEADISISSQNSHRGGEQYSFARSPLAWIWILVIVLIFIGAGAAYLVMRDRFEEQEGAELDEIQRRKSELREKALPQPDHCPYCGEALPPAESGYTNCPKCGKNVVTMTGQRGT